MAINTNLVQRVFNNNYEDEAFSQHNATTLLSLPGA